LRFVTVMPLTRAALVAAFLFDRRGRYVPASLRPSAARKVTAVDPKDER
jgi:hypothetical protein